MWDKHFCHQALPYLWQSFDPDNGYFVSGMAAALIMPGYVRPCGRRPTHPNIE